MKAGKVLLGVSAFFLVGAASEARADDRTHDGFYLQLAAGLGYLSSSVDAGPLGDRSLSGLTFPSSLYLGGSPVPGFALGGGLFTDYAFSPTYKVNGQEVPSGVDSMFLVGIGPIVDIYPDPTDGLHFQALIGWGGLETSYQGNVGGSDPTGLVLSVGGGYDFWVGSEWSIGVLGRFTYAPLKINDVSYNTISPSILASFTYH